MATELITNRIDLQRDAILREDPRPIQPGSAPAVRPVLPGIDRVDATTRPSGSSAPPATDPKNGIAPDPSRLHQRVTSALNAVPLWKRFFARDNAARALVAGLSPDEQSQLALETENLLLRALGVTSPFRTLNQSEADRAAVRALYTTPTTSPKFNAAEKTKLDGIRALLASDAVVRNAAAQWEGMSTTARKAVVERLVAVMAQAYGLPELNLEYFHQEEQANDAILVGYLQGGTVNINTNPLAFDQFLVVMHTTIHETTHAYQTALRNAFEAKKIPASDPRYAFIEALALNAYCYVDGLDFYDAYDGQPMEQHADANADYLTSIFVPSEVSATGARTRLPDRIHIRVGDGFGVAVRLR